LSIIQKFQFFFSDVIPNSSREKMLMLLVVAGGYYIVHIMTDNRVYRLNGERIRPLSDASFVRANHQILRTELLDFPAGTEIPPEIRMQLNIRNASNTNLLKLWAEDIKKAETSEL